MKTKVYYKVYDHMLPKYVDAYTFQLLQRAKAEDKYLREYRKEKREAFRVIEEDIENDLKGVLKKPYSIQSYYFSDYFKEATTKNELKGNLNIIKNSMSKNSIEDYYIIIALDKSNNYETTLDMDAIKNTQVRSKKELRRIMDEKYKKVFNNELPNVSMELNLYELINIYKLLENKEYTTLSVFKKGNKYKLKLFVKRLVQPTDVNNN